MSFRVVCSAMVMGLAVSGAAFGQSPLLTTTEAMIPSSDPGVKLYVRNKHAEGMTSFSPDKTLLFIHGATYPAETSFDLPIDGVSMMDLFAQHGFDVYLVDVRSYGRSTRPPEMDQPPEANKPIATSEEAGADLAPRSTMFWLSAAFRSSISWVGHGARRSPAPTRRATTTRSIGSCFMRRRGSLNLRSSRLRIRSPPIVSWPRSPRTRGGSEAFPRKKGRADSTRRFRPLVGRDARHRPRWEQNGPAKASCGQRRHG